MDTRFINVGDISYDMAEEVLLQKFFYNPMKPFGVRELGRETHLDTKTVMKYLKGLVRKKIVLKKVKRGTFPYYKANKDSDLYKFEKSHALIKKMIEINLIPFLEKEVKPKAIVLFGSIAKGTYHQKSDIDLFIQGEYKLIELFKYEKKLGHKISLFFEKDLKQLSEGLLINIFNGHLLAGKLQIQI